MRFDQTQATAEGWGLFAVDGRLMLQRIDCPEDEAGNFMEPPFESDTDALIAVALKAHAGSTYHIHALDLIGANTKES